MDDIRALDHEISVTKIDMGLSGLIPRDKPIAVSEEGRLGDSIGHLKLHDGREERSCRLA
jgi:hypothetical protein